MAEQFDNDLAETTKIHKDILEELKKRQKAAETGGSTTRVRFLHEE